MTDAAPPPRTTAAEPPWTPRGLWWRSAWPSIIVAFAAFQLGVLTTLAIVWGRLDEPRLSPAPPPAAPPRLEPVVAPAAAQAVPAPSAPAPAPPAPPVQRTPAKAPALVEVQIDSVPEGATVRIAGAVWGVTPLTAFLPGHHPASIDLELAGHQKIRTRWNPDAGGPRAVHVDLVKIDDLVRPETPQPAEHQP